jgi:UPF0755 protein
MRRRTTTTALSALTLAGLLALGACGAPEPTDFTGEEGAPVEVVVEPGDTGRAVGADLAELGVVASQDLFVEALGDAGLVLEPGRYTLNEGMSARAAVAALESPESRNETKVTLREGLSTAASLELLAGGGDTAPWQAAVEGAAKPSWMTGLAEGVLFPATYVTSDRTPEEVVAEAVRASSERYGALLAGKSDDEVRVALTKASLVQAEAGSEGDMRRVARVIENRLAAGMKLEFDSSVHYAAGGARDVTTTAQERAIDNPFNTYRYAGLPPGPINSPGLEALKAVLSPEEGDWLFFVTTNPDTGETVFSSTYEEHLAAVEVYRQWLASR